MQDRVEFHWGVNDISAAPTPDEVAGIAATIREALPGAVVVTGDEAARILAHIARPLAAIEHRDHQRDHDETERG
jgi:hypothetical protein